MVIAAALTAAVGLYAASGPQTGHRTHRGGLLLLRTAGRAARGRRGLAAAGHPGRRVRDPAVRPRLPAGEQRVYAAARLFPARAVGRARRAVPVGRGRTLPGHGPAPPEERMSKALYAEWTKLRTLPGTGWLLLGVVAATVIISATVSAAVSCSSTAACHVDVTKLSLTGTYLGQAVVAIVAVLAVSGEYATGMIAATLAAMPHRATVLGAKAAVVSAVTLAAGTLAMLGSVLAGRLILPGHGYTPANGYLELWVRDSEYESHVLGRGLESRSGD